LPPEHPSWQSEDTTTSTTSTQSNTGFITEDNLSAINEAKVEVAGETESEPIRSRLGLRNVSELVKNKKAKPRLIQGLLDELGLSFIYGAFGSLKSFMVIYLAICVATGRNWCGLKVKKGLVVIIAGEGTHGYSQRFAAALSGDDTNIPIHVSQRAAYLDDEEQLIEIVAEIEALPEPPVLIVADTLSRCSIGDENAAKDASHVVHGADYLKDYFQCHIMIIHHTGKNDNFRGSTVYPGAADTIIRCDKSDDLIATLNVEKVKDGKQDMKYSFKGREVILDGWVDEFGETPSSLAFEQCISPEDKKKQEMEDAVVGIVKDNPRESQTVLITKIIKETELSRRKSLGLLDGLVGKRIQKTGGGNGSAARYTEIQKPLPPGAILDIAGGRGFNQITPNGGGLV
jgi:hypothetical protein